VPETQCEVGGNFRQAMSGEPSFFATWKFDAGGVPTDCESTRNDYMKAVEEHFELKNGGVRWKSDRDAEAPGLTPSHKG
jgi:hypothetical protein